MSTNQPGGHNGFSWDNFRGLDPKNGALQRGFSGSFVVDLRRMFAALLKRLMNDRS